mmetsp:Transcript_15852/g.28524  ORF Transcript_15852/g.28524 Transcript_15852/m.28524 type:complete len:383 (+) Transcript_15852:53-1201(+)
MMEPAHSPTPPGTDEVVDTDDPFSTMSSSSNLEDLVLDSDNVDENDVANNVSTTATADAATVAAGGEDAAVATDVDPWAVLAAAAGEEAPAPSPPSTPSNDDDGAVTPPAVATAVAITDHQPPITLAHAQGETFTMPTANEGNDKQQPLPSLAAQIQSSTANLSTVLSTKIHEVDAATGLSTKVTTKARVVDEQYHITEKWSAFHTNVLKPTTTKTIEKTKVVSSTVKEKLNSNQGVKEGWGSIKQRSAEMGIAKKWTSMTTVVGSKWNETSSKVGESVEHWKEEQERKKSMANANEGGVAENGERGRAGLQKIDLEGTKEKVVESWTGGVNWVSQRIQNSKLSSEVERSQQWQRPATGPPDAEFKRLDTDGLPTSFRKDEQ